MTEVGELSAVELFGRWHDGRDPDGGDGGHGQVVPAADRYRSPLPAAPPGPGRQYRFEVDLDRCTGCKACVTACHSLNGLDEQETWRSVGLLVGGGRADRPVWNQHVTTACHHCLEPACLAGCPVEAYEKDPVTGIVAHLDDQCIGCRYCMLTCPYEVPTFNHRLGIVRKCDMCADRLAVGEAPACVQGCPTGAIAIGVVDTAELGAALAVEPEARLVPTAPRSAHTAPTTVYLSGRPTPSDAVAGDDHRVVPASDHPPLVAMLVLTQMSVGAFVLAQLASWSGPLDRLGSGPAVLAWFAALVALGASVLHLGRPLVAWRAVLGLRHSWLSREIVAFGAYAALGGATAAAAAGWLPTSWEPTLGAVTAVSGVAGVWCSAQLYAVTGRSLWRIDRTMVRFTATMAVAGAAAVAMAASLVEAAGAAGSPRFDTVAVLVMAAGSVGVLSASTVFLLRHRGGRGALGRSAGLMLGPLRARLRRGVVLVVSGVSAAVAAAGVAWSPGVAALWWAASLVLVTAAAWIERSLFFVAVAPDRMPGAVR